MKATIEISVPTIYQSTSASSFGITVKKNMDGSISGSKEFATIQQARKYLKEVAHRLYDGDKKAIRYFLGKDYLQYDAATAYINPINK